MRKTVKEIVEMDILKVLSEDLRLQLKTISGKLWEDTFEIRLRIGQSLSLSMVDGEKSINSINAELSERIILTEEHISKCLGLMSQNSLYSVHEEIKAGFITLRGGHRVGLSGKVLCENDEVKNIKYISSLNIRIAREVIGSADFLMDYIISMGELMNTLIISPPRYGKTTVLRDLIRQISNGIPRLRFHGKTVGLIDERSEIAACHKGIAQNNIGTRTDVMDNCPKSEGIIMMVRSMGPSVIATDEIGTEQDAKAILTAVSAGVQVITTAHGNNINDLLIKPGMKELVLSKVFRRYIILCNVNDKRRIRSVFDQDLCVLNEVRMCL